MHEAQAVKASILERLVGVIDPETGVDVIRMRLIEDLTVDETGQVSYTFRPSSALCPIAVYLVVNIKSAVAEVPGVDQQRIKVINYVQAEELTELINELTPGDQE
jgi:metal-sulfur cluster biosynthetic enzyme